MYLTCITITQSTIITSPIGFNIGLTNIDARLKQRCINVVSALFQRQALTLYRRCATLKIRRRILFHFQRQINVISTLIHNVETTLIRRSNVGWARTWPLLRLWVVLSENLKISVIMIGDIPILTLTISVAKYWRFLVWIVTDLSFSSNW